MCTFAVKSLTILAKISLFLSFLCAVMLCACGRKSENKIVTPWGEVTDTVPQDNGFDLDQITANGEMIMLTVSGPDTYYDYRGRQLGTQYMLCQKFADKIGVSLRVEVCRDTVEMLRRLTAGEGDIVVCQLKKSDLAKGVADSVVLCGAKVDSLGTGWTVSKAKPRLAAQLNEWYKPSLVAEVKREEAFLLSSRSVRRHVYSPMLNRKGGVISHYDNLFVTYSRPIRWDWKLMAAQCYQESTFDPQAKSWAGACGLMQIMPGTAAELGLPADKMFDPESNIAAAAKLLGQLEKKFGDVRSRTERIKFVLASYNGGYHHVRDAMALTEKYGGDKYHWDDVSKYILLLSTPQYYRDPVVKFGYMRGSETANYVVRIHERWSSYGGIRTPRIGSSGLAPQKATHKRKKKYSV